MVDYCLHFMVEQFLGFERVPSIRDESWSGDDVDGVVLGEEYDYRARKIREVAGTHYFSVDDDYRAFPKGLEFILMKNGEFDNAVSGLSLLSRDYLEENDVPSHLHAFPSDYVENYVIGGVARGHYDAGVFVVDYYLNPDGLPIALSHYEPSDMSKKSGFTPEDDEDIVVSPFVKNFDDDDE